MASGHKGTLSGGKKSKSHEIHVRKLHHRNHITKSHPLEGESEDAVENHDDFVLCQVKTRDWPGAVDMEALRGSPVLQNARKLVHRWRDRQRRPGVKEI